MIKNLRDYFRSEQEIFLDTVSYTRIEESEEGSGKDHLLFCTDNVRVSTSGDDAKVIVTRTLNFEPDNLFRLSISFGVKLVFNERKAEQDWDNINLAEEFKENGDFAINPLVSRISLLIAQITASYGQQPIIVPGTLAKKKMCKK